VFTEPLLRNGLHKPVVPPQLGADDIENTDSFIVACWTVFTELLLGKELIKSVTIYFPESKILRFTFIVLIKRQSEHLLLLLLPYRTEHKYISII
jgi:hypothetical protein